MHYLLPKKCIPHPVSFSQTLVEIWLKMLAASKPVIALHLKTQTLKATQYWQ